MDLDTGPQVVYVKWPQILSRLLSVVRLRVLVSEAPTVQRESQGIAAIQGVTDYRIVGMVSNTGAKPEFIITIRRPFSQQVGHFKSFRIVRDHAQTNRCATGPNQGGSFN